jgi:hypothetical protein
MMLSVSPNLSNLSECDVRLVVEAECSCCGPIHGSATPGLQSVQAAMRHSAETGHVVILNGTVDRPELEEQDAIE